MFLSLLVDKNAVIKELTANIQTKIKDTIKRNTDLEVNQININNANIKLENIKIIGGYLGQNQKAILSMITSTPLGVILLPLLLKIKEGIYIDVEDISNLSDLNKISINPDSFLSEFKNNGKRIITTIPVCYGNLFVKEQELVFVPCSITKRHIFQKVKK